MVQAVRGAVGRDRGVPLFGIPRMRPGATPDRSRPGRTRRPPSPAGRRRLTVRSACWQPRRPRGPASPALRLRRTARPPAPGPRGGPTRTGSPPGQTRPDAEATTISEPLTPPRCRADGARPRQRPPSPPQAANPRDPPTPTACRRPCALPQRSSTAHGHRSAQPPRGRRETSRTNICNRSGIDPGGAGSRCLTCTVSIRES